MRLPMAEHVWRQEQTLQDMMARLGVDPAVAARWDAGDAYRQARTNCIVCWNALACRAWLADEIGAIYPIPTCRNRTYFLACHGL